MPTMDTLTHGRLDTMGANRSTDSALQRPPLPAESVAPSLVLAVDSAAGDTIFHGRGRCFTCHGASGEGTPRLGPSLSDSTWLDVNGSLAALREVIANGIATPRSFSVAMPAYTGALTPSEIARVAAYVYTLSHRGVVVSDTARADSVRMRPDTAGPPLPSQLPGGDPVHPPPV
jgi:mono/diheme cytochrome c family protein